jgi:medium-chain acyl-[acyl-carrier-protein] hydrolase
MDVAPWIRKVDPTARARVICLPYAGGGTADYRRWAGLLPGGVDLCPVVLPGREARLRERPYDAMAPLVSDLSQALLPLLRRAPYVIYGHSMGAWVGFELVRALRRVRGPMPAHLVVAARRAPDRPSRHPQLSHLPEAAFVAGVQERYGGIPDAIRANPELMALFLPTLRADFSLLDAYRYADEPPLDVPILALRGRTDEIVAPADVRAWEAHTTGRFEVRTLQGGHFFLQDGAEQVTELLGGLLRPGVV